MRNHLIAALAAATSLATAGIAAAGPVAAQPYLPGASASAGTASAGSDVFAAGMADGRVRLVSTSGSVVRRLAPATGAAVRSLSMDGNRTHVFYARNTSSCNDAIYRVPTAGGASTVVAYGTHAQVSPGGGLLAFFRHGTGCRGESLVVRNLRTGGERVYRNRSLAEGSEPWVGYDVTWRPDGAALVVTMGWEGTTELRLVDLRNPPADLDSAMVLPGRSPYRESWYASDYAGKQLTLAGECCFPEADTSRVARRDSGTGELRSVLRFADGGLGSLTGKPAGQLLYTYAGSTWHWDGSATAVRIAGAYSALDW